MNFHQMWHRVPLNYALNEVQQVGYDLISDRKLFGPVYHGTTPERLDAILKAGFKVHVGAARYGDVSHGFEVSGWGGSEIPPPVHFLGYGVYFTQSKSQVKLYNNNSLKGVRSFYLDVPRLEEINFAAPHKMMAWWRANGYDMEPVKDVNQYASHEFLMGGKIARLPSAKTHNEIMSVESKRIAATKHMTDVLKSKWDAVLFSGKSMYGSNLDGNQICVFDPTRIYLFNPALNPAESYYPGDRVKIKGTHVVAKINGKRPSHGYKGPWEYLLGPSPNMYYATIAHADLESIRQLYKPQLLKVMLENPKLRKEMEERASRGMESFEDSIQQYTDYLTSNSLKLNFPEALIERKLQKGERVK